MQLPDTMRPIESMSQHEKKHMKLLHERHEALTDSGSYSRFLFGSYSQALTAVFFGSYSQNVMVLLGTVCFLLSTSG